MNAMDAPPCYHSVMNDAVDVVVRSIFSVPFALSIISMAGQFIVQNDRKVLGWTVAFSAQPIWAYYAIHTEQYGFVVSCITFGTLQIRGIIKGIKDGLRKDDTK